MLQILKTVKMQGPQGQNVIVNAIDVAEMEKQGFKVGEKKQDPPPAELGKYSVSELKGFAGSIGIDGAEKMKRDQLVEVLTNAGFVPPTE